MNAITRLGIAYGKLGISTDPELIARRSEGVQKAADELQKEGVAPLIQAAFAVGSGPERFAFLSNFGDDPTFGVQAKDKEAELLACAVAEYEMENDTHLSAELALTVVACACGGLRGAPLNEDLVSIAQDRLAHYQGQSAPRPKDRTYSKQPKSVIEAIDAVTAGTSQFFTQSAPTVVAALQAVAKYGETVSLAAAKSDEELLGYVRSVEEEMRVYWWVTGGWSTDCKGPFRDLKLALAAICAGNELAAKHSSPIGLFAAPALLDMILERGRSERAELLVLQDAVTIPNLDWRKQHFASLAAGPLAALLPISAALGLSAASEDANDWIPRFGRVVGLAASAELSAPEFGLQLYRERLVARALG